MTAMIRAEFVHVSPAGERTEPTIVEISAEHTAAFQALKTERRYVHTNPHSGWTMELDFIRFSRY